MPSYQYQRYLNERGGFVPLAECTDEPVLVLQTDEGDDLEIFRGRSYTIIAFPDAERTIDESARQQLILALGGRL
jgi:hypothetical protein